MGPPAPQGGAMGSLGHLRELPGGGGGSPGASRGALARARSPPEWHRGRPGAFMENLQKPLVLHCFRSLGDAGGVPGRPSGIPGVPCGESVTFRVLSGVRWKVLGATRGGLVSVSGIPREASGDLQNAPRAPGNAPGGARCVPWGLLGGPWGSLEGLRTLSC